MIDEKTTELLNQALMGQKRAVRCYELIAAAAPDFRDKELLLAIRREERRHYYLLEGVYEDICGHAYNPPRVSLSLPRVYVQMLKTALCDKLAAIDFYEALLPELHCVKNQELLTMILSDQKEHARILVAIYDRNSV